jgi:hypothetical protein
MTTFPTCGAEIRSRGVWWWCRWGRRSRGGKGPDGRKESNGGCGSEGVFTRVRPIRKPGPVPLRQALNQETCGIFPASDFASGSLQQRQSRGLRAGLNDEFSDLFSVEDCGHSVQSSVAQYRNEYTTGMYNDAGGRATWARRKRSDISFFRI